MFCVTLPATRDCNLPRVVTRSIVAGHTRSIRHVFGDTYVAAVTGIAAFRQERMGRGEFARHVGGLVSCQRIYPQPCESQGDTE